MVNSNSFTATITFTNDETRNNEWSIKGDQALVSPSDTPATFTLQLDPNTFDAGWKFSNVIIQVPQVPVDPHANTWKAYHCGPEWIGASLQILDVGAITIIEFGKRQVTLSIRNLRDRPQVKVPVLLQVKNSQGEVHTSPDPQVVLQPKPT